MEMYKAADGSNTPVHARTNFSVLGIEQSNLDGRIKYRVGRQVIPSSHLPFNDLWDEKNSTHLAGDQIPIYSDHESLRVYGTAHDETSNFYDFKMVIENKDNGLVYAEIHILKDDKQIDTVEGFVFKKSENGDLIPLDGLDSQAANKIILQTREGPLEMDIGRVDFLVVDCGVIDKEIPSSYRSQHVGSTFSFYVETQDFLHERDFANIPVATLKASRLASKFEPTLDRSELPQQITQGHISPKQSGLGFGRV